MLWTDKGFNKIQGMGIVFIVLLAIAFVLLLTACGSSEQPIDLCDPAVSFIQVSDTTLDAYKNGVVVMRGVTLDDIIKACAR